MNRVEAVIFAAAHPVNLQTLRALVGVSCDLGGLIADLQQSLAERPFELVEVHGGFQYRTRTEYAAAIRHSGVLGPEGPDLTKNDHTILVAIAYFQPVTRAELSRIMGRSVSRDAIASLSRRRLIAAGPRSPVPGAPYTYVTTAEFLTTFTLKSLSELPDMEKLAEAGLLNRVQPGLLEEGGDATSSFSEDDAETGDS